MKCYRQDNSIQLYEKLKNKDGIVWSRSMGRLFLAISRMILLSESVYSPKYICKLSQRICRLFVRYLYSHHEGFSEDSRPTVTLLPTFCILLYGRFAE